MQVERLKKNLAEINDSIENHPLLKNLYNRITNSHLPLNMIGDCDRMQQVFLNILLNANNNTFDEQITVNVFYEID